MKKRNVLFVVVIILIASFCFSFLIADEIVQTDLEGIPFGLKTDVQNVTLPYQNASRDDTVAYEIIKEPTQITGQTTYYDYCPGGYWNNPIAYQAGSYFWDNFFYMTFMQRVGITSTDNRRQCWAVLNNSTLEINSYGTITTYDKWQGFGSIDIHQPSGYCIASLHELYDTDQIWEMALAYDDLATFGLPGFWSSTVHFWNDEDNDYCWPRIYVGPSPLGVDSARIYQVSTNSAEYGAVVQKSDMKIDYIDVDNSTMPDFTVLLDTNNWTTITPLITWIDSFNIRPDAHFAVNYNPGHEGEVSIIGTNYWYDELTYSPVEEGLFVWESSLGLDNELLFEESNLHTDGPEDFFYGVENVIGMSTSSGYTPDSIYVSDRGTHSTAKYSSDGNLHWPYAQMYYIEADEAGSIYIFKFAYPQSEVIWDGTEFTFRHNQEMPYIDDWSGHDVPFTVTSNIPPDTLYHFDIGFSLYEDTSGPACGQENLQQLATNFDNGNEWMAWLWVDGTYSALGSTDYVTDPDPQYIPYVEHPIIYISVSDDDGTSWAEPIKLTDLALEGINVYPYGDSKIKDIGGGWGQLVIYYLDDYVFNSTISLGINPDAGAMLKYMVVNIDFKQTSIDPDNPNMFDLTLTNFPNPFISSTTINFTAKQSYRNAKINVYNVIGQLVTTLDVQAGEQPTQGYATWNGKDMSGKDVANGIYLYKVEIDGSAKVQKMMLTR
ncbi:MAG: T9SS type A sorting domain-containing protein [Candidatus Cloacimonetes bacterium]|nr:T9SS type A sorting domain-containing protein [Candidatus Cloacimonadota bacterium]